MVNHHWAVAYRFRGGFFVPRRVSTMLRLLLLAIGSVFALALVAIILLVSLSVERQK